MLFIMIDNCRKNLTNSFKSVSADKKLAMIIKNCKMYWSYVIILDNILLNPDQKLVWDLHLPDDVISWDWSFWWMVSDDCFEAVSNIFFSTHLYDYFGLHHLNLAPG